MNRPKLWISFLALLIVISVGTYFQPERRVMRFYNRNIDEMKSIIDGSDEQLKSLEILNDITVRRWSGEHEIIQFDVTGAGIVPTSKYYGFFYCKDDVPVSYQNGNEKLTAVSEDEWKWKGSGDNRGYVKKIEPCWYYFEASY